jgi:hypothetical protein
MLKSKYIIILIIIIIVINNNYYYDNLSKNINNIPNDSIFIIHNVFNNKIFQTIKNIILTNYNNNSFRHNNIIRNGSSISYQNIQNCNLNKILKYILNSELLNTIYKNTKIKANFIPKPDPNRISILVYDKPNDGIKWHYDGNPLYGNRWACILTIVNKHNNSNKYSSAKFIYKKNNKEFEISNPENSLVIFKGDKLLHKVSSIKKDETRIVVSLVLCDVCKYDMNPIKKIRNYVVNKSFYG